MTQKDKKQINISIQMIGLKSAREEKNKKFLYIMLFFRSFIKHCNLWNCPKEAFSSKYVRILSYIRSFQMISENVKIAANIRNALFTE